jgi:WD40 repeat protein
VRGLDTDWDLHLQSFDTGDTDHWRGMFSFSPNSRLLCWASDKTIEVWDIVAGQQVMQVPGIPRSRIMFCSNGCTLALTGISVEGAHQTAILDIATSSYVETISTLEDPMKNIQQCVFSADGKWLAATHRPDENDENVEYENYKYEGRHSKSKRPVIFTFQLYSLETREWGPTLQTWHGFDAMAIFSTKEGAQLALRCQNDLIIRDFTTGSFVGLLKIDRQFDTHDSIFPFAFSPDGQLLASACSLRNVKTGQVEKELEYSKDARSVNFSPDGCQLLMCPFKVALPQSWMFKLGDSSGNFPVLILLPQQSRQMELCLRH